MIIIFFDVLNNMLLRQIFCIQFFRLFSVKLKNVSNAKLHDHYNYEYN